MRDVVTNWILEKITSLLLLGLFSSFFACSGDQPEVYEPPKKPKELGKVSLYLTTGDQGKLLSREPDLSRTETDNSNLPTIHINPEDIKQEIEGFGAALTGSSAYLINQKMRQAQRQALLGDLFSTDQGIGLSYLRMTIGASDFSWSNYTYNDLAAGETDYKLEKFSIAKDKQDVVPVFKEIMDISPHIRIMGSP